MDYFKQLELTEKGFVKPGIYLSEFNNLIIFYPSRYKSQMQFYWNSKWKFQILDVKAIKTIQKLYDYEKMCDL